MDLLNVSTGQTERIPDKQLLQRIQKLKKEKFTETETQLADTNNIVESILKKEPKYLKTTQDEDQNLLKKGNGIFYANLPNKVEPASQRVTLVAPDPFDKKNNIIKVGRKNPEIQEQMSRREYAMVSQERSFQTSVVGSLDSSPQSSKKKSRNGSRIQNSLR